MKSAGGSQKKRKAVKSADTQEYVCDQHNDMEVDNDKSMEERVLSRAR